MYTWLKQPAEVQVLLMLDLRREWLIQADRKPTVTKITTFLQPSYPHVFIECDGQSIV